MNTNFNNLTLQGNLIDASAGTGKTYQLANRFIALLSIGVPAVQMIALTFTRKAAGEFLTRIIKELAKAAESPQNAESMRLRINSTLSGHAAHDPSLSAGCAPLCPELQIAATDATPDFFREKLEEVLRSISSLNLSTLDSFFNKIVSAHSVELGLGSVSLLSPEELEKAQFQALQTLLSHVSQNADYTDAFMTLFLEVSDEKLGSMMDTLQQQVNSFLQLYLNFPNETLWGYSEAFGLPHQATCKPGSADLSADELIRMHEAEINELSQQKGCSAFKTFINKMKSMNFKSMSKVEKAFNDAPSPHTALGRICELARPIYELQRYNVLRRCLQRSHGMARLMQTYCSIYNREVTATGKLVFDDITRAMPLLLKDGDMDVQRRLDLKLRHWMLDEFQDTSPQQWEALHPLLTEAISKNDRDENLSNHTIFVVGDEKQSIYAWRGASPELFRSLKTDSFWTAHLRQTGMAHSYRSAPIIMDFINQVFSREIEAKQFPKHESAHRDMPGYVRVTALPATLQEEQTDHACAEIGRILTQELHFTAGGITAAILVRKNSDGLLIQQWLKRNHPELPVALLSDKKVAALSPLGEMLLCFFRWLLHPSDEYCLGVLNESPLCLALKTAPNEPLHWAAWRNKLDSEGYAAILSHIALAFPDKNAAQDATLREWLAAAMAFDVTGGSLEEWLLYISNKSRNEDPPKSCIHIMTMHKSKGLEYDAVILPLLGSQSLCDTKRLQYLEARDEAGKLQGILLPPGNAEQRAAWPQLEPFVEQWKDKQLKEARNLLYVALTRAAHANYILINGKTARSKGEAPTTFGAMICQTVKPDADAPDKVTHLQDFGDRNWRKAPNVSVESPPTQPITLTPPVLRRMKVSPSKAPSTMEERTATAEATTASESAAADFGSKVHKAWEEISWLDSPLPRWMNEGEPRNKAQEVVYQALKQPEIAAFFTAQPGQEVYNEQPLEAITKDGEWLSGTIDRLVITHDAAGSVTAAHIIDFKTNRPGPKEGYTDFYAWLREHYEAQMTTYREHVATALGIPESAIDLSLISCPQSEKARVIPYEASEQ